MERPQYTTVSNVVQVIMWGTMGRKSEESLDRYGSGRVGCDSTSNPKGKGSKLPELKVTLPFSRLKVAAERLGQQDVDACPPEYPHECWRRRGLEPYTSYPTGVGIVEIECKECWIHYLTLGN